MPGVWVFPGGVVEADESVAPEVEAQAGATDGEELAHRACAVAGAPRGGRNRAVRRRRAALPWSRWITPEVVPVRFDTRFYVALAPPHSPPRPDGAETTEAAWIRPARGARPPRGRRAVAGLPDDQAPGVAAPLLERRGGAGRRTRTRGSSRFCRASSARTRGAAWSCPASPATDRRRAMFRRDRHPAAGGPGGLRALHHLRVHDRRRPPAADRLAGDAVLLVRRANARHLHRAGLPEEGQRRAAEPAGGAAVLGPDRLRDRDRDPGAGPGGTPRSTTATWRRTASATGASRRSSCRRRQGGACRRASCTACSAWYVNRIYVKVRPERVFVWPDGDPAKPPQIHDSHVEEVRSGHSEEPLEAHEPSHGRRHRLGRANRRSSVAATRPRCSRGWRPMASRSPSRVPVGLDAGAPPDPRSTPSPAGLPLTEGRACLTAHGHGPDFNWRENFQVRGDLVRAAEAGRSCRASSSAASSSRTRACWAGTEATCARSLRFYRTARRELKKRSN